MNTKQVEYPMQLVSSKDDVTTWEFEPKEETVFKLWSIVVLGAPAAMVTSIKVGEHELLTGWGITVQHFLELLRVESYEGPQWDIPPVRLPARITFRCQGFVARIRLFGIEASRETGE